MPQCPKCDHQLFDDTGFRAIVDSDIHKCGGCGVELDIEVMVDYYVEVFDEEAAQEELKE